MSKHGLLVVIVASLLIAACGTPALPAPAVPTAQQPAPAETTAAEAAPAAEFAAVDGSAISMEALKNATYSGIYDEPITLTDGLFEGDPASADDPSRPVVEVIDDAALVGDLDGDGVDDAVVFLLERDGGSGAFTYVAVQLNRDGQPVDAGAVRIEDRIGVKSAVVGDGQIALEIITQGPGDVACCSTHKAAKTYAVQDGRLAETTPEGGELVQVSAADLDGSNWSLLELAVGQPALADSEVTLSFAGDPLGVSGLGGCNNFTGSFSLSEEDPQLMTVGPLAATAQSCPDPVGSQESAYFAALNNASRWGYVFGKLALYYADGENSENRLLFVPQATPTAEQGDTATAGDESDLEDQIAVLASTNPPPRLSERKLGVTIVPCDVAELPDEGEVEGETYYCGILTVPQNWDEPDGRNLDLTFMVAKATGENPESDPLVYLAGGPGQSSVLTAIGSYDGVRATRDIVRIDQRGTGLSQRLDVSECLGLALGSDSEQEQVVTLLQALNQPDRADTGGTPLVSGISVNDQVNQICWNVFSEAGLDLNQFTTQAAARDVVELVKALEYDSFNLHGVSYGTRLAMTVLNTTAGMEDAPLVRSAVLDSSFPPSVYLLSSLARNRHDQILQLFDDCQQDAVCRDAYPNLKQRLHTLFAQLAAQPLVVDGQTVTSGDVVKQLANLSSTRPAFMPRMIAELESGTLTTFNGLVNGELGSAEPEGVSGLDLDDPLQAFLNDVIPILSQGGGMEALFGFMAGFSDVVIQDDPVAALSAYIKENYEGDRQAKLLDRASSLTAEDFATSPLAAQMRQEAAGSDQEAASQEETDAAQLRKQRLVAVIGVAHFLNLTVHCSEDTKFERFEDAVNSYNDLEFPQFANLNFLREQAGNCAAWPVDVASIEVKNPVSSTVPTLILQGAYDTKTPAYMGRRAARELANSTLVIVPQQGHEVWTSATSCAGQIATSFVLNPDAEPDLSCLDARRPQWALPE